MANNKSYVKVPYAKIKEQVSILSILDSFNIEYETIGSSLRLKKGFRAEDVNSSVYVYPDRNEWKDFGGHSFYGSRNSDDKHLTVIDMFSYLSGLPPYQSGVALCYHYDIEVESGNIESYIEKNPHIKEIKLNENVIERQVELAKAIKSSTQDYDRSHLEYMYETEIYDFIAPEIVEYAEKRGITEETLKQCGIKTHFKVFGEPQIAFCSYDENGIIKHVSYKNIEKENKVKAYMGRGSETSLWGLEDVEIKDGMKFGIIEGQFDRMSGIQCNLENITSLTSGSNNLEFLNDPRLDKIYKKSEYIYIIGDNDSSGYKFRKKVYKEMIGRGVPRSKIRFMSIPDRSINDLNEYHQKHGLEQTAKMCHESLSKSFYTVAEFETLFNTPSKSLEYQTMKENYISPDIERQKHFVRTCTRAYVEKFSVTHIKLHQEMVEAIKNGEGQFEKVQQHIDTLNQMIHVSSTNTFLLPMVLDIEERSQLSFNTYSIEKVKEMYVDSEIDKRLLPMQLINHSLLEKKEKLDLISIVYATANASIFHKREEYQKAVQRLENTQNPDLNEFKKLIENKSKIYFKVKQQRRIAK